MILANNPNLRVRDLPPEITQKARGRAGDDTLDLQEHERVMIEKALERFGGNRRKAAEALKISTVTLWRKMKQFGISSRSPAVSLRNDIGPKAPTNQR